MAEETAGRPLPAPHRAFLEKALPRLREDQRLVGVAAGGSYVAGSLDEFSDLDLVVAVSPGAWPAILEDRVRIAGRLGPLLASFTGEHVGEPRLLICLYGPPLLHVDLKFVSLEDAAARVEDPVILWERDGLLGAAMRARPARYPGPDLQWIEDRFWIWLHYGATKLGRGELFETLDFLAFLRARVLGPLALEAVGAQPAGVRKLEFLAPEAAREMQATVATHDFASCAAALKAAAAFYRKLRGRAPGGTLRTNPAAESAAMAYLAEIVARG